jgi:hypothetical protein
LPSLYIFEVLCFILKKLGRGAYRVLVGKREVKRPFGRSWHRWANNIKMDL